MAIYSSQEGDSFRMSEVKKNAIVIFKGKHNPEFIKAIVYLWNTAPTKNREYSI